MTPFDFDPFDNVTSEDVDMNEWDDEPELNSVKISTNGQRMMMVGDGDDEWLMMHTQYGNRMPDDGVDEEARSAKEYKRG